MQPLRPGDRGSAVAEVRRMLASIGLIANTREERADTYDEDVELAIRHFQQQRGMVVTGAVDDETYSALTGAHWRLGNRVLAHDAGQALVGDDVSALQLQLLELGYDLARVDGIFAARTAAALQAFQREYGLVPDGICGPATLLALRQLDRRVKGGRPQLLREEFAVQTAGPSLLGKRIVLDPGHGGDDPGTTYGELSEAELTWDLASRLDGRLTALGVQSFLTRGRHNGATDADRARLANEFAADLVLSLHVDGFASARANGVASYYFGGAESSSTIGERLAGLVQRETVARTGLTDGRTHGKSWALLRLTRMPIVRVELGYLSSPVDRPRLVDPLFRDTVAEGLLVAVQRLYLPTADDPPTGVMRIPAQV